MLEGVGGKAARNQVEKKLKQMRCSTCIISRARLSWCSLLPEIDREVITGYIDFL